MPRDASDSRDSDETVETVTPQDGPSQKYTGKLVRSVQGLTDETEVASGRKGSEFQTWADQSVFDEKGFHGQGHRLTVRPEDNKHLDKLGDGVGISKEYRQSDSFIDDYGEIYELKAGYQNGGIDEQQAYEYSLMQDAGKVRARRGDGTVVEMPVKGVTYIFDSKAGARANRSVLDRYGFGILYRDDQGQLLQLDEG